MWLGFLSCALTFGLGFTLLSPGMFGTHDYNCNADKLYGFMAFNPFFDLAYHSLASVKET